MSMRSGYFDKQRLGGYTITDPDLKYSYQYNLLNGDIHVKLDQNGPISVQAAPPCGLVLLRREQGEKYSKWLTFVRVGGKLYSNFARPGTERPQKTEISFLPERAQYRYEYAGLRLVTTLFVPARGGDAVCTVEVTNTGRAERTFEAFAQAMPLLAPVNAAPWDKPEWYVRTSVHHDARRDLIFFVRRMDPRGDAAGRRNVAMFMSGEGVLCAEYLMEEYEGAGDFYAPDALAKECWNYDFSCDLPFGERGARNSVAGFPCVFAAKYAFSLRAGESRTLTQVLSVLPQNGGEIPAAEEAERRKRYFSAQARAEALREAAADWQDYLTANSVRSGDAAFDGYVNGFLPLQMRWVSLLDRGWPTGMRGTRDASNDCMGILQYDCVFARKVLLHLFDCECTSGRFLRQVGQDRKGPHDMREYVDGGAFALEFLYEYLCYSKEFSLLDETAGYCDGEEKNSIEEHVLRALGYYADAENIGADGLCKIREGDWFDGVNRAGLAGRGESVTVSCQFYMAVRYAKAMFAAAGKRALPARIEQAAERAAEGVRALAFNREGFFNGLKNDDGDWIFSDRDPDGAARMYAVPNAFALFTGVATQEQSDRVLQNFARLRSEIGYKLFSPPFAGGMDCVGRIACGDVAAGLLGNSTVYNHGSQGFLCRACCAAGNAAMAQDVLGWLLPYDAARHPESETGAPPYAIVNCYQDVMPFRQRAGFSFLTGTVAMAVRIVYNFMFGIRPCAEGICIRPCLTDRFDGAEVIYRYRGKNVRFTYRNKGVLRVFAGGKPCGGRVQDAADGRDLPLVPEALLSDGSQIEIWY